MRIRSCLNQDAIEEMTRLAEEAPSCGIFDGEEMAKGVCAAPWH